MKYFIFSLLTIVTMQAPISAKDNIASYLETYSRVLYYVNHLYVDPNKAIHQELLINSINGMLKGLDPHTSYLPKTSFDEMKIDTRGKFAGIGIRIGKSKQGVHVISVIEDSPAAKLDIKAGDRILAIDGQTIDSTSLQPTTHRLRGAPGSKVRLKLQRQGLQKPFAITITRKIIRLKVVSHIDLDGGIYYVAIRSFQENTQMQLRKILLRATESGNRIHALILDLRDNPGGLLSQSVKICDLFLSSGVIVSTLGRNPQDKDVEFAHKKGTLPYFPMVTLVNGGSASASEIVAGALQDHKRSLIMGQTTFGKGSVQTLLDLPDGSGLKLTIARYYTPLNRSIQAKGITPDIFVPRLEDTAIESKPQRSEKDLRGHFETKDLPLPERQKSLDHLSRLNSLQRRDYQLVTAINYLKNFARFSSKRNKR